jgi:hypothetical protein
MTEFVIKGCLDLLPEALWLFIYLRNNRIEIESNAGWRKES